MNVLKFTLSGTGACFNRPQINSAHLTYSHIHKLVLLGIFGAILGYSGHKREDDYATNMKAAQVSNTKIKKIKNKVDYPEFYEKLKSLKISIVPHKKAFQKKMFNFNCSTGHANNGSTLIVKEERLVNPKWDIYVAKGNTADEIFNELISSIMESRGHFIPYLGRNSFPADFDDVELLELSPIDIDDVDSIDSVFLEDKFSYEPNPEVDEYKYSEYAPISYKKQQNYYIEAKVMFTNMEVIPKDIPESYMIYEDKINSKKLYFL